MERAPKSGARLPSGACTSAARSPSARQGCDRGSRESGGWDVPVAGGPHGREDTLPTPGRLYIGTIASRRFPSFSKYVFSVRCSTLFFLGGVNWRRILGLNPTGPNSSSSLVCRQAQLGRFGSIRTARALVEDVCKTLPHLRATAIAA